MTHMPGKAWLPQIDHTGGLIGRGAVNLVVWLIWTCTIYYAGQHYLSHILSVVLSFR